MEAYAVIETGGKQYRVQQGDILAVERLEAEAGNNLELDKVLAVSNGSELVIGKPYIPQASVTALVMEHIRGPKVYSFKKKRRKSYSRKVGHRQELTRLKIQPFLKSEETAEAAPAPEATEE